VGSERRAKSETAASDKPPTRDPESEQTAGAEAGNGESRFGPAGIMGCSETEPGVANWAQFVTEFALDASPSWLFRGQADFAWGLGASLRRAFVAAGIADPTESAHFENSSLGFFKD
jgi:hypothetical protein